jgi:GNAT superfamily N-acetyltransferase
MGPRHVLTILAVAEVERSLNFYTRAAVSRVESAGGRVLSPALPRDWGDRAAYFADPDGNVVVVAVPLTWARKPVTIRAMELRVTDESGGSDFAAVQKGLGDYNAAHGLEGPSMPLNIYARDEDGQLLGGLCGVTADGRLWVGQVWVDESRRGQGLGRALMDAAEREGRERGCGRVYLDTFEVQAPGFYEKLGYRVAGVVDDFPDGHRRYFFSKNL